MNAKQIEIGDKLLNLLIDNDGQLADATYNSLLLKEFEGCNLKLIITTVIIMIEDYGLIRRNINNMGIKVITSEGIRAAEIGLEKYIEEFVNRKELEFKSLEANIRTAEIARRNSKYSLTISILALIAAIFAPILAEFAKVKMSENNDNGHSMNYKQGMNTVRNNLTDSTIKQNTFKLDSTEMHKSKARQKK